jgi:hypothetical protein
MALHQRRIWPETILAGSYFHKSWQYRGTIHFYTYVRENANWYPKKLPAIQYEAARRGTAQLGKGANN